MKKVHIITMTVKAITKKIGLKNAYFGGKPSISGS